MPVFLQGRRAFYHPCAADIADATPYQSTASPIRASPTRAAPIRASPIRAAPAPLRPPVTPTLTSPPPLRLPPATPTLTLPTSLSPPSDTEAPHGPQPLPLGLKCRHGPRPFCSSARSTDTARAPSAVLRDVAQPIPVPALPGAQKGGRNRTEVRPPPKSNQSVAAASPRQVIWLSGKSPFLKVGIRTPGNTRSSPAPKRTVFRYRAALRKVHHQANKATSRRSRTDN